MKSDPFSLTLMPAEDTASLARLKERSFHLAAAAALLGKGLHPYVQAAIGEVMASVSCFYSNLIEKHLVSPTDIDRALKGSWSENANSRDLQMEAVAHIETQTLIDRGQFIAMGLGKDLVQQIHFEFCSRLPDTFRRIDGDADIKPGQLRDRNLQVGRHIPVDADFLPSFMTHFDWGYHGVYRYQGLIAAASAHHRLLWIHPFTDGNGRTARLYSHAALSQASMNTGLWSLSRGFALSIDSYRAALERADFPRQGALDGRGSLSDSGLTAFISYFIDTCVDQIAFMADLLSPSTLFERLMDAADAEADRTDWPEMPGLAAQVFTAGEVSMAEITSNLEMTDERARRLVEAMKSAGFIASTEPSSTMRLAFPLTYVDVLFPGIFPDAALLAKPISTD